LPRRTIVLSASALALLVVMNAIGGGPSRYAPDIVDHHYVERDHRVIVRTISRSEYRDLDQRGTRIGLLVIGGLSLLSWLATQSATRMLSSSARAEGRATTAATAPSSATATAPRPNR
jgi:hypothetical protein